MPQRRYPQVVPLGKVYQRKCYLPYFYLVEQYLTYGLLNGELKHINDVLNGKNCNCRCPKCDDELVAKNNPENIKVAHFAHASGSNCPYAYETALHLLAKKVVLEIKQMRLPDYHHDYNQYNERSLFRNGEVLKFDDVKIECVPLGAINREIIADAIGFVGENTVLIEFHNTHAVDEIKTEKLRRIGLTCVEVSLAGQVLDYESLKSFLLSKSTDIKWIHNPGLDRVYKTYKAEQRKLLAEKRAKQQSKPKAQPVPGPEPEIIKPEFTPKSLPTISSAARYEAYKSTRKYKFYTIKDGIAAKCPITKDALNELKTKQFYNHSIVKRIIDGEYWNGTIYDNRKTRECYIFLNNKREDIYLAYHLRSMLSEEQERSANLFYAGMKSIEEIYKKRPACGKCNFSKDNVYANGYDLIVCNYEHLRDNDFVID